MKYISLQNRRLFFKHYIKKIFFKIFLYLNIFNFTTPTDDHFDQLVLPDP